MKSEQYKKKKKGLNVLGSQEMKSLLKVPKEYEEIQKKKIEAEMSLLSCCFIFERALQKKDEIISELTKKLNDLNQ